MKTDPIRAAYEAAIRRYREFGVEVEAALETLDDIPVSMHCWQGDDVRGFEAAAGGASGGILSTGNYPGAARDIAELRREMQAQRGEIVNDLSKKIVKIQQSQPAPAAPAPRRHPAAR